MKKKSDPGVVPWVQGIAFGMMLMHLFWGLSAGSQHIGAIVGASVILMITSVIMVIVTRRARR